MMCAPRWTGRIRNLYRHEQRHHPSQVLLPTEQDTRHYPKAARHLRLVQVISFQKADGLHTALLQRFQITSHSRGVAHIELNPSSRPKCRYIMRKSIDQPESGPVFMTNRVNHLK